MNKLNVLFITRNMQNHIEKSTYYLGNEMKTLCHLTTWKEDGSLPEILANLPSTPDFILFNDQKPDYCPWIQNISNVDIPKGALVHDLHYRIRMRKKIYQKERIEYLFVQYRDAFLEWYPEFKENMIWFPHHVPDHTFKDYQYEKDIDYLMIGSLIPHLYPLRIQIYNKLKNMPGFKYFPHPGYKQGTKETGIVTGQAYAQTLNKAKIFLTCDSIYQFPLLKYFESLASGALLMAPGSQELRDLGYMDGHTFVEISEETILDRAMHYLKNVEERNRIVKNGINLIQERHTTANRAKQLINSIELLIKKQ